VLSDCAQLHQLNYLEAVTFFHGQKSAAAGLLQFNSLDAPMRAPAHTVLWPDTSLKNWLINQPNARSLLAKNGHPNELGHQWIKDRLIVEIDRAII